MVPAPATERGAALPILDLRLVADMVDDRNRARRNNMRRGLLTVFGLILTSAAFAHHSFAVFFNTEENLVSVTGVVKEFRFSNPHGVITLAVRKSADTTIWRAETNSPSMLRRHGWTPDSLHVGDKVTIEGWLARDGTRYLRMKSAHLADGRLIGQPLGGP
jgi:hypothetical protein